MLVCGMERDEILNVLRLHEAALQARGIMHAALFGSRARGDAGPDSDTDILIELDQTRRVGLYEFVGIARTVSELFDGKVDVMEPEGMKPHIRARAVADAIYAF